ncbi:MAG: DUF2953 domain-containing protein [Lachnospiraceae bacterium]|nr:DUF2953 domain-containing protein [Lachnospiraceae bacterium]
MLHIILLILKIIGIVLLLILGLLLLALICILFVPVRYKGKGQWYDEKHGKIIVSWLLHIISIHITYDNGETDVKYKLFGIKFNPWNKNKKKKVKNKKIQQEKQQEKQADTFKEPEDDMPRTVTLTEPKKETEKEEIKVQEQVTYKKKKRKNPFEFVRKIRFKIRDFCDKLKKINERKNNLVAFLREEDTKIAWKVGKEELIKLIKYILPTKLELYMKFGFEDPSNTGKLLGIIYMFYGFTKKFQIYPDFENVVFEGETTFKGRIRVIRLLVVFLKLWRNEPIKNTIERAKQI